MTEPSTVNIATAEISPTGARTRYPKKLAWTLGLAALGLYVGATGIGVVAQVQLQDFDAADKVANLAIISSLGALFALISVPLWGAFSDRIRSRWGRRNPLAFAGTFLLALALGGMALSTSVVTLGIAFCVVQICVGSVLAPLSAVIPDRVPAAVRGFVSSILGLGVMAGIAVGSTVGASLASSSIPLAYLALAAVIVVCLLLFILLNPDVSSSDAPRKGFSFGTFVRTFWVNPRRHPDFAWVFFGRAFIFLGYSAVNTYAFYILEDYIGLPKKTALGDVPLLAVASLLGILTSILVSGWWSDRIGRRKPFVVASSIICAVGVIIPFIVPTLPGMIAYSFVTGIGYGCYLSIDNALITQVLPSSGDAAKDLGVAAMGGSVAMVIAPALAGLIVSSTGQDYTPLFLVACGVSIVGALCILPVKRVR
jgi:MFS family permease